MWSKIYEHSTHSVNYRCNLSSLKDNFRVRVNICWWCWYNIGCFWLLVIVQALHLHHSISMLHHLIFLFLLHVLLSTPNLLIS